MKARVRLIIIIISTFKYLILILRKCIPGLEGIGGVDHSSNLKVSAAKGSARRDSWDAIAKTRHLMSANR